MSLMGLDIGTTGTKAIVFDLDGNILSSGYEEYHLSSPQPGWLELDPEEVWQRVVKAVRKATADAGDPVQALGISCLGEAAVPVARGGTILANTIVGFDNRALPMCSEWLDRNDPAEIMSITGMPPNQMYTLIKLMWLKANRLEVYSRIWKFLCYEEYAMFRMGLTPTTDYSVAGRTMAFDVREKRWSEKICDLAGVDAGMFADAKPSGTVVGEIGEKAADELGLPKGCKVVTGGHDQPAGALGAGVIEKGVAIDATGTVECFALAFDEPVLNDVMLKNNFCCYCHVVPGLYVTLGFNLTGGSLLKWFRDTLASEEKRLAEQRGLDVYDVLMEEMVDEPTDIFVLPHFTMTGTPYMDADPTGAVVGLSLGTTRGQLVKAVVEGITYEMKLNMALLRDAGIEIGELRAIGGGAKSPRWLQVKADMFNTKVVKLSVSEAACLGVAMAAGVANRDYASFREAVDRVVKPEKDYLPDPGRAEVYERKLGKYRELYPMFKQWKQGVS